ncbi:hypothetical protein [Niabella aquatica]
MLKILGADKEIISANIRFTGDAIALLNNYARNGNTMHLDDWDWYKELRSGALCYIVTDIKKAIIPV